MPKLALGAALLALVSWVGLAPVAHANDEIREIVKEELAKDNGLRAYWSSGLRFDSADKSIRLKLGGRIMLDTTFYDDDDFQAAGVPATGNTEDGFEFRRVRLYNAGLLYDHVEYKVQVEFAGATGNNSGDGVDFNDVYIGLTNLDDCLGCLFPNIRVGHQFVKFGLESHTSSKYITFIERSSVVNALAPARKTGLAIHDHFLGDTLGYSAHLFSPTSDTVGNGDWDDGIGVAGRLWWVPWYECDCECKRLQVGVSYMSQSDLKGKRFRARPTHTASRFLNTGTIGDVESYTTLGAELAFVYGPFSVQGEYMVADVDSVTGADPSFSGWYGQVSWWLTGECRAFKHGAGSRVKPCCNFLSNDCCCFGGFELAARYESLDLQDSAIDGGEMTALTVGVNWHLNPNTRFMVNYFTAEYNGTPRGFDPDGTGGVASGTTTFTDTTLSGLSLRFQVDF